MKTFLVTGAAGFIGAAVAQKLAGAENKVVTIDNLRTGFRAAVPTGVEFIEGDCQDQQVFDSLSDRKFDCIFHIAGQSSGEISFSDPVYDLQTNAQSTLLLLKLAAKTGCRKFVYASSMSVYGDQPDMPINESARTRPKSFYGVGKIASEHYMRIYHEYGITSTALRLFNVYGPGQNMENMRQGMVSIFLSQAIKDRHIHVKGRADRFRDFVFIDNVADAFLKAAENFTDNFSVYNVASGVKTMVGDLVAAIQDSLPFDTTVEYAGSTPGDQCGIVGDASAIHTGLGWHAEMKLEEGISKMTKWALAGAKPTE
ncbi:MAG: NAD-dependent epimerase/dehydratase family protein [Calditrichaeota bacterium]|nr:NAD-dependent epimerase/dehydratase family protein [Calditrichota bacterium]